MDLNIRRKYTVLDVLSTKSAKSQGRHPARRSLGNVTASIQGNRTAYFDHHLLIFTEPTKLPTQTGSVTTVGGFLRRVLIRGGRRKFQKVWRICSIRSSGIPAISSVPMGGSIPAKLFYSVNNTLVNPPRNSPPTPKSDVYGSRRLNSPLEKVGFKYRTTP